jgi:hypothetical protein
MTSTQHTRQRLYVKEFGLLCIANNDPPHPESLFPPPSHWAIAQVLDYEEGKVQRADARRLAAAWNATLEISSEALEADIVCQLLASLRDTTEALANVLLHHGEAMSVHDRNGRTKVVSNARTLIAKATGQQGGK